MENIINEVKHFYKDHKKVVAGVIVIIVIAIVIL
jgi:hypothetical protein